MSEVSELTFVISHYGCSMLFQKGKGKRKMRRQWCVWCAGCDDAVLLKGSCGRLSEGAFIDKRRLYFTSPHLTSEGLT